MTEKIIKILESYESLDENGNEYIKPKDYNSLASMLEKAINYTRCCKSDSELLPDTNKHQCNCGNTKDRLDCGFECYNK